MKSYFYLSDMFLLQKKNVAKTKELITLSEKILKPQKMFHYFNKGKVYENNWQLIRLN
jgi:hypothetical protein